MKSLISLTHFKNIKEKRKIKKIIKDLCQNCGLVILLP